MLAWPELLAVLHMPCDSTHDDLLHDLSQYRGQVDRPIASLTLLLTLLVDEVSSLLPLKKAVSRAWLTAGSPQHQLVTIPEPRQKNQQKKLFS